MTTWPDARREAYITCWITGRQYVTLIEALGLILLTRLFSNSVSALLETLHVCQDLLRPTFLRSGIKGCLIKLNDRAAPRDKLIINNGRSRPGQTAALYMEAL